MRAFARMITQNHDRANDLVQDTIVRALKAEHQYTPGTNMKAWLFTISTKSCMSIICAAIKLDSIRLKMVRLITLRWLLANQESHLGISRAKALHDQTFQPNTSEILILVGASGFSYEEAAEICGCAVGTSQKSRLSRGRQELFQLMMHGEDSSKRVRAAAKRVRIATKPGWKRLLYLKLLKSA